MFLFLSSTDLLVQSKVNDVQRQLGLLSVSDVGSGKIVWINDGFTQCEDKDGILEVGCLRKNIEELPVCGLRFIRDLSTFELYRNWSGEFLLYYSPGLTCVTTHLKLVKALTRSFNTPLRRLEAGRKIVFTLKAGEWIGREQCLSKWFAPFRFDRQNAAREVRRLVHDSIKALPEKAALLLSGGIDSSSVAVAARNLGKEITAFTLVTSKKWEPKEELENDRLCAQQVARHLQVPLHEVHISPKRLVGNIPRAVYLSETHRGTIIDESAALIELAKQVCSAGYSDVWTGETADDLFGGFKFTLRYLRGQQLRRHYRSQLKRDLPNELAIVQNNFAPWRISVCNPLWTEELLRIGYNLPLRYRIDQNRLMKMVLRDAFRNDLPDHIVNRPKCITRDATGVRAILAKRFGTSRERYRSIFTDLFKGQVRAPASLSLASCRAEIH